MQSSSSPSIHVPLSLSMLLFAHHLPLPSTPPPQGKRNLSNSSSGIGAISRGMTTNVKSRLADAILGRGELTARERLQLRRKQQQQGGEPGRLAPQPVVAVEWLRSPSVHSRGSEVGQDVLAGSI